MTPAKILFAGALVPLSLLAFRVPGAAARGLADALAVSPTLPFASGERLTYAVTINHTGRVGDAVMTLSGPVDVRGTQTLLAAFDTQVGLAHLKGSNTSRSWIDPTDMTSLRFARHEHRPLASDEDSAEIFPDRHHWDGVNGASGAMTTAHPLDELSFIYFLRTASFAAESTYSFDRHYDAARNPTTVRVVKHETLHTPAGIFDTIELEMRVKDGTDYQGTGVLFFWISTDACHLPVRIESAMPMLGTGILTLESAVTPGCQSGARVTPMEK
jgi:hypothetical protein